jgi:hypothetical protein
MRRIRIMLMAITMALVIALPAGAVKPTERRKPPMMPEPPCRFEYGEDFASTNHVALSDICIWTLPEDENGTTKTGVWEMTLRPTLPHNTKKPLEAWMDVRDGAPGNWCTLAIGTPSGFSDRWKAPYPTDPTLTGEVYLPGDENYSRLGLADGMCLGGGAGGDYFAVGSPKAFYLRADGDVTVKWLSEFPPPPDETP